MISPSPTEDPVDPSSEVDLVAVGEGGDLGVVGPAVPGSAELANELGSGVARQRVVGDEHVERELPEVFLGRGHTSVGVAGSEGE